MEQDGRNDAAASGEAVVKPGQLKPDACICVWDLPLRLFHWLLVICITASGISGWLLPVNWLDVHLIAGWSVLALIVLRLVWGFTGTTYSRFASFAYSPAEIAAHLKRLAAGTAPREAGHNPLGAVMIFALLLVLAAITLSGLVTHGGAFKQGPFKHFLDFAAGSAAWSLHAFLAFVLAALIAGHIGGVVAESARTRENLARAMLNGRKRAGFDHALAPVGPRGGLAFGLAVTLILGGAMVMLALASLAPKGVPQMMVDAAWQAECGACHIAFHPSLLPQASWAVLMSGLADHFGEDASLDPAVTTGIAQFLAANAAEHWDTLAANRQRQIDPARPAEITATPFWRHRHKEIAAALFTRKPVGARQDCTACHRDAASGLFAPQMISLPEETSP